VLSYDINEKRVGNIYLVFGSLEFQWILMFTINVYLSTEQSIKTMSQMEQCYIFKNIIQNKFT